MASKLPRHEMPTQNAEERIHNFSEVALGYAPETAIAEAQRCLNCKKPKCVDGCPVLVDIPEFISSVAEGNFVEAARRLKLKTSLPAVCGRVCPQENQCEGKCVLGIKGEPVAIGRLERFVADWEAENSTGEKVEIPESNHKKVAIIGAGPAGLACAGDLAKLGYEITVFEALHTPGGVLMYGIPEFRLPKDVVQREIDYIKSLGVRFEVDAIVGKLYDIDELRNEFGYEAFFVGTGAGLPYFMNLPGENLNGIFSANEFLTRANLMKAYDANFATPIKLGKRVAVIGGGNVAMDAARTALRLGAEESFIVYRRSKDELPARAEELEHAIEEGVQLVLLSSPVSYEGDEQGIVRKIVMQKYELGEPDESGRRKPVPIEGCLEEMDIDTVVVAIGQGPNPILPENTPGLEVNKWGNIVADENGRTSIIDVYAGGDVVTGAATVIKAMGAGKDAAAHIHEYLSNK